MHFVIPESSKQAIQFGMTVLQSIINYNIHIYIYEHYIYMYNFSIKVLYFNILYWLFLKNKIIVLRLYSKVSHTKESCIAMVILVDIFQLRMSVNA